jgi:hypothetical protein
MPHSHACSSWMSSCTGSAPLLHPYIPPCKQLQQLLAPRYKRVVLMACCAVEAAVLAWCGAVNVVHGTSDVFPTCMQGTPPTQLRASFPKEQIIGLFRDLRGIAGRNSCRPARLASADDASRC